MENPSECPHCHNGIEPRPVSEKYIEQGIMYSIWKCTHRKCGKLFVAAYEIDGYGKYLFKRFLDGTPISTPWPDTIKALNSKFTSTYMQSQQAESMGLDEISGMGYRKAIEYLVKDYAINNNSLLKTEIENDQLMAVINKNFNQPREFALKDLLTKATWLGNDQSHYLNHHPDFDINHLKELIYLVVHEINLIERKNYYEKNIQSKNTKP